MDPSLLMWGLFTCIMVPGYMTELCVNDPPEINHATFKALAYKNGTKLNCECKRGFRRIKCGSSYMICTENSSWDNQCQCESTSKQVTPPPEEQKERTTIEMQTQTQPEDQLNLAGYCREPPLWEHEDTKRIYHFMVGQTVHYQCIQGYKALQRHPATSTCKMICGETRWTRPQLTCINENEHHQFPGEEDSQVSVDAVTESETSCPPATTDFQQPTEVATTMKTFIFRMEHQVVVAGCVFLLISVFVLSGLTWQRRWKKSRRTI
ncbi:interleukin-2 receptor subunit alpha [Castor canadensis]|uniref:Interleukin-2 receptor subunit alpha n=1 Tax=Castor canadensis TaxID=51338 RepID=A0AC58L6P4_CASCN